MKISIIVPYHNVDKQIFLLCMKSIFSQTYKDFEVVIVNDGSSDEYINILDEISETYQTVRIINQNCHGASNARNRGVAEAKGKYIAFVDADDMVVPTYLEEAVQILEDYHADLVAGGVKFVFKKKDMISVFKQENTKLAEDHIKIFEEKNLWKFKNHLASSRKLIKYQGGNVDRGPVARLVKRELAEACPFHDELIMWEDLVWNLELLDMCKKVCAVTKTWYLYYQNPISQIHQYRPNVVNEVEITMSYMKKLLDLDTDDGFETFGDHVCDNLRRICKLYFLRNECPLTLKGRKKEYIRIYTCEPWAVLGTNRYYNLTCGKNKLMSFLYKKRLFFMVFGLKEKIKNKIRFCK